MKKKEMAALFDELGSDEFKLWSELDGSAMDEASVREMRIAKAAISTAFAYCSAIAAGRGLVFVGENGKVDRAVTHWLLARQAFAMLAKDSE
ncbi:hypothetical protein [Slackia isoflavoniconvertens]|uniref:Uncharacterized protein n=1 Tax=Slackia isoflavoniconvertens TaxID=572010 RepID=A0A3N0I7N8_9ACTN|nr:hypothetical protein [Slackia isoflavoniconvertens]MBB3279742.1 hypothetical protein [Slackia isoflavoniconvertens]RNM33031.1 hypothetical protein DMP05_09180 [Slackia isoflavoniconvertens]